MSEQKRAIIERLEMLRRHKASEREHYLQSGNAKYAYEADVAVATLDEAMAAVETDCA